MANSEVARFSKLVSSFGVFNKSWKVAFCDTFPVLVATVGPVGISFLSLNNAGLFAGKTLIKNDFESLNQVKGEPKFAFRLSEVIFLAVAVAKSTTQSSTPFEVVFVNAKDFSSGENEK